MKRFFLGLFVFLFPWVTFLIKDNPGAAIVALVMQASLFGWPFAAIWAWRAINEKPETAKAGKKVEEKQDES